jgi:hypothetical protein
METTALKEEPRQASDSTAVSALRQLLRFPLQDPNWRNKFLIGSVIVFLNFVVPLLPMIALGGYCLKVMRQGVRG